MLVYSFRVPVLLSSLVQLVFLLMLFTVVHIRVSQTGILLAVALLGKSCLLHIMFEGFFVCGPKNY